MVDKIQQGVTDEKGIVLFIVLSIVSYKFKSCRHAVFGCF
jgi:hypothetical protein